MSVKILIADDHPLFRAAMCHALTSVGHIELVETSTFPDTLTYLELNDDIDLLFLDLTMPGNEGLNGLAEVHARYPDVLVVVVTAQEEPDVMAKSFALGASGFVPKSASVDCIIEAVDTVLDGETWIPSSVQRPSDPLQHPVASNASNVSDQDDFTVRLKQLTPHQLKVLQMVSDGLLNKQIAYELAISESTVKQHVSAVLRKLGVINRTKAGIAFKNAIHLS
ncbi:DNA-binding response regulator [Alteromonas sp. BL110]|uniref:response regulator n=1 Tax=Alteromonas sp. BL110 TaxID=1714845 RepID=UPI000E53C9BB|nr:response regulator transcription factor [Alteromonas sp. BL110]AXT37357.1 DNA-binding response regulator [Alteromonas sp. BL110]RKM80094.1 response regulator [Alteromonas sp. BL110]